MAATHFIAADIGNARIKLGLFADDCAAGLPEPLRTLAFEGNEPELDRIGPWLAAAGETQRACKHAPYGWWLASVNRPAATRLIDWLRVHRPEDRITLMAAGDLPLEVRLERPDMVGIDRLVDAVAVNRLRRPDWPAVIVDVGSAITVDLVSADGAFLGGAILPGLQMAARALHDYTDLLPLVDTSELSEPPPALGTATIPAMQAGLFWGAVGAIRQLIEQLTSPFAPRKNATFAERKATLISSPNPTTAPADVFLTGGAGVAVAELLGSQARHVPNLTLSGIAAAAMGKIDRETEVPSPSGRGLG
jgi:type III pantothenate kinase